MKEGEITRGSRGPGGACPSPFPKILLAPSFPVSFFHSCFTIKLSIWSIIGIFVTLHPPPGFYSLVPLSHWPPDFALDPSLGEMQEK